MSTLQQRLLRGLLVITGQRKHLRATQDSYLREMRRADNVENVLSRLDAELAIIKRTL